MQKSTSFYIFNLKGFLFGYDSHTEHLIRLDGYGTYAMDISSDLFRGTSISGLLVEAEKAIVDETALKTTTTDLVPLLGSASYSIPTELLVYNRSVYIPNRRFSIYDPANGVNILHFLEDTTEPQASIAIDNGVYIATYPDAYVWYYPYDILRQNGVDLLLPEYQLFSIPDQCRPYMMDISSDKRYLAIGSGPLYGQFGGALSIYDCHNKQYQYTIRNIIPNQSIYSLCFDKKDSNIVFVGSIATGENTAQTIDDPAHIVKWDIQTQTALFDVIPEAPDSGVKGIRRIVHNGDALYALTSYQNLYKIDDVTGEVINARLQGDIRAIIVTDSGLFGCTTESIVKIDPNTLDITIIYDGFSWIHFSTLTADQQTDTLYFFDRFSLTMLQLSE